MRNAKEFVFVSVAFFLAPSSSGDEITEWRHIAFDAARAAGISPLVTTRANAIVQASIFDAVNGIERRRFHPRCMELDSEPLRPPDAEAARQLHNLAALYVGRRRYQQAEPLYRQAMAEFERRFGPEDWEVALVMNNLALLCQKTGRLIVAA